MLVCSLTTSGSDPSQILLYRDACVCVCVLAWFNFVGVNLTGIMRNSAERGHFDVLHSSSLLFTHRSVIISKIKYWWMLCRDAEWPHIVVWFSMYPIITLHNTLPSLTTPTRPDWFYPGNRNSDFQLTSTTGKPAAYIRFVIGQENIWC